MAENYTVSGDFSSGIAPGQLHNEIVAESAITTTLIGITRDGDDVEILFAAVLASAEKTALDNVIAAHVPDFSTNEIISTTGYIELNSSLADNGALLLQASDPAGGIDIDCGTGGITIDSNNTISLDAAAESNFTTSAGNLILRASSGLVNINGGSGINIGNLAEAQPINMGTGAAARTISIGNTTGATQLCLMAGTGGYLVDTASGGPISLDATGAASNFSLATTGDAQDLTIALTGANNSSIILDSAGTGTDAIRLDASSAGGILATCAQQLNLVSSQVAGGAITLDTSAAGGGITISSGSFGFLVQVAWGGVINMGTDTGTGNISIGTGARERTVTIGSTSTASSTVIQSGTGNIEFSSTGGAYIFSGISGAAASLRIAENTANGTNYVAIEAPSALGANFTLELPAADDTLVGRATSDTLTNKTITDSSNNVTASGLFSATTTISVDGATAPTSGQVLTATSGTAAEWQSAAPFRVRAADNQLNTISDASGHSWTASELGIGDDLVTIIERGGHSSAVNDAFPSAATIVGAFSSPSVGDIYRFWIINTSSSGTFAFEEGVGGWPSSVNIKSAGGGPISFAAGESAECWLRITNISSGTEAADLYCWAK